MPRLWSIIARIRSPDSSLEELTNLSARALAASCLLVMVLSLSGWGCFLAMVVGFLPLLLVTRDSPAVGWPPAWCTGGGGKYVDRSDVVGTVDAHLLCRPENGACFALWVAVGVARPNLPNVWKVWQVRGWGYSPARAANHAPITRAGLASYDCLRAPYRMVVLIERCPNCRCC